MNTEYLKPRTQLPQRSNSMNLDLKDGNLSKFWSGLERIITISQDRNIVINITINAPNGGGATVNWKQK